MDDALRHDGGRGLVGLEARRIQGWIAATDAVRSSACSQCDLVLDFLRNAPARLGVRGDRDSLVGDSGDNRRVLPSIEDCRLADDALLVLGQLCERTQLYDLAIERGMIVPCV